jgi:hypothetical protein
MNRLFPAPSLWDGVIANDSQPASCRYFQKNADTEITHPPQCLQNTTRRQPPPDHNECSLGWPKSCKYLAEKLVCETPQQHLFGMKPAPSIPARPRQMERKLKLSSASWQRLEKLILVPGHAVYHGKRRLQPEDDRQWVLKSYQKGEPPCYIEHVRRGVELAASRPNSLLIFSGGQTRHEAGPISEAQSYWMLADRLSWWGKVEVSQRATTEEFARDSFENLLFGIARFKECTGHFPTTIEIVGWKFKRERFGLHRQAIRWPAGNGRYYYYGVNDPPDLPVSNDGEAATRAEFEKDPFGTGEPLAWKRVLRNPFRRQFPYPLTCPEMAGLLRRTTAESAKSSGHLPQSLARARDSAAVRWPYT